MQSGEYVKRNMKSRIVVALCAFCATALFLLLAGINREYGTRLDLTLSAVGQSDSDYISFQNYHHYNDMMQLFADLQHAYPDIARTGSIGTSVEGRNLQYLEITNQVNSSTPGRPKVKLVGNMHGDETVGRELLIYLSQYLLHSHQSDNVAHGILNNMRLFIMPSMNPDGFEHSTEGSCETPNSQRTSRENSNAIDLNRNFPDQFEPEWKTGRRKFEPETKAMMDWITSNKFILSANFHAGSEVASYPFDDSSSHRRGRISKAPDDEFFRLMASTYANAHTTMHNNDRKCGEDFFVDGVTNGAKWYDVAGGMQDYNYIEGDCMEITLELTCCKYPMASTLSNEWSKNKNALLDFLQLANRGMRGFVVDTNTGAPIKDVVVTVSGISKTVTSDENGAYWRLLTPGVYTVTFSKERYFTPAAITVDVTDESFVVENISLLSMDSTQDNTEDTTADQQPVTVDHQEVSSNVDNGDVFHTPVVNDDVMADENTDVMVDENTDVSPEQKADVTPQDNADATPDENHDVTPVDIIEPSSFVHHNYESLTALLMSYNKLFPEITRLYSVGKSVQGRELWVMEISDNPGQHEPGEPEFKYVSNMHGNEVVGRELTVNLIEYLLVNYGRVAPLTKLVDTTRIHLMPSMNPDGYEKSQEGDADGVTGRSNADFVDLNRNFPDQFYDLRRPLEPETEHMMKWMKEYPFVLSANMHGGSLVANYPYDATPPNNHGSSYSASPDDAVFKHVSEVYSAAHSTMHAGDPCPKRSRDHFDDGITNGAEWYQVHGGMQDWNYVNTNCFEITLELGCVKFPVQQNLRSYWEANKVSLILYMNEVHKGITGFVHDIDGNLVGDAVIKVEGINHDIRAASGGDYWRLLVPGNYRVSATMGSLTAVQLVKVNGEYATVVNFTLPGKLGLAQSTETSTTTTTSNAQPTVHSTSTSISRARPTVHLSPAKQANHRTDRPNIVRSTTERENDESFTLFGFSRTFIIVVTVLAMLSIISIALMIRMLCSKTSQEKGFHRLNHEAVPYYDDGSVNVAGKVLNIEYHDDSDNEETVYTKPI